MLLPLLVAATASAAEGESSLSVDAGFGSFSIDRDSSGSISGNGGVLLVDYQHAFGDTFGARASVGGGVYDASTGRAYGGTATLSVVYVIDVLRYVPYVDLGAGALIVGGDKFPAKVEALLELGGGIDVIESRSFSWGLDLRFDAFASQARVLTVTPRVTWRWGYF